MRSLGQGSSGCLDASGCDPPIPRDQGRRAHSCTGCQRCGPKRFAGRSRPPQAVPPLASAPHGPQDGGQGARRPRRGQPLCPPGRGPPIGSPMRSPRHAGNARARVSAPRHSPRPQHFLPHSAPPHVPSGSRSWARVPGGDDWPTAGTRTPGEGGPSARHALRPCRFSAEDARRSSQSKPSAQMLLQSSDRFCFESPPPAGP